MSASEKIRFQCTRCSQQLSVPARSAGAKAKCPKCGERNRIPAAVESVPSLAPREPQRLGSRRAIKGLVGLLILVLLGWLIAFAGTAFKASEQAAKQRRADDALWFAVQRSNSPEDMERYLQTYPAGLHVPLAERRIAELKADAQRQREESEWLGITQSSNVEQMDRFLAEFPSSSNRQAVEEMRRKGIEKQAWVQAYAEKKLESVEHFLSKYPRSEFTIQAEELRGELMADRTWKAMAGKELSEEQLEAFVRANPTSQSSNEARSRLDRIRVEEGDWRHTLSRGGIDELEAYLKRNPTSSHVDEAHAKLAELMKAPPATVTFELSGDLRSDFNRTLEAAVKNVLRHVGFRVAKPGEKAAVAVRCQAEGIATAYSYDIGNYYTGAKVSGRVEVAVEGKAAVSRTFSGSYGPATFIDTRFSAPTKPEGAPFSAAAAGGLDVAAFNAVADSALVRPAEAAAFCRKVIRSGERSKHVALARLVSAKDASTEDYLFCVKGLNHGQACPAMKALVEQGPQARDALIVIAKEPQPKDKHLRDRAVWVLGHFLNDSIAVEAILSVARTDPSCQFVVTSLEAQGTTAIPAIEAALADRSLSESSRRQLQAGLDHIRRIDPFSPGK